MHWVRRGMKVCQLASLSSRESGLTGVPSLGIFRRAAEVTFGELRTNRDSLTSVLEAFIHDPLTEWQAAKVCQTRKPSLL